MAWREPHGWYLRSPHHFNLLPSISRLRKLRILCCSNAALFSDRQHIGLVTCGSSGNRLVFTIIGPECDYEASCELFSCLIDYCRGGGSAPLPRGRCSTCGHLEVLNDAENDRFRDDVGVAVKRKRAHNPFKAITAQHNIQPVSGNHPHVEQAWAKARAEIERLEAIKSNQNETLEETRATSG